jgi:glycosyltransferase involved in cell wall biosynthesis
VVNDGCTDDTEDIVLNISDKRIRYVKHDYNRGLSAARNTGMKLSRGDYINYLDSDDIFYPEKFETLIGFDGLVIGQASNYFKTRIYPGKLPSDRRKLLFGNPVHVGSTLISRAWQEKVGFFNENLTSWEDWDMLLRLIKLNCPIKNVAAPVSVYREHSNQMTRDKVNMVIERRKVIDLFYQDKPAAIYNTVKEKVYKQQAFLEKIYLRNQLE